MGLLEVIVVMGGYLQSSTSKKLACFFLLITGIDVYQIAGIDVNQ